MFSIPRNSLFERKSCPACSLTKVETAQISTATRVLAEIIASDVPLLVTFNHAIDGATRRSVQPARARNQDDPVKESSYFLFHKDAVRVF